MVVGVRFKLDILRDMLLLETVLEDVCPQTGMEDRLS